MQHYIVLDGKYLTSFSPLLTEHDTDNALRFNNVAYADGIAYALEQTTGLHCAREEKVPLKNYGVPCVITLFDGGFYSKEKGSVPTKEAATVIKGFAVTRQYIQTYHIPGYAVRKEGGRS